MGKPKQHVVSTDETMDLTRQQQRFNNPNVYNQFGSTETTFGADDQATITQQMSPEMAALVNSQMQYVGQGPQMYQGGNNSGLESMFNNFAGRVGTGGMSSGAPNMGQMLALPPPERQPIQQSQAPQLPPMETPSGGGIMGTNEKQQEKLRQLANQLGTQKTGGQYANR